MVSIRDAIADRFAVNTKKHILLKGYVNGNWGEGNVEWLIEATGDAQKPGEPTIRTTTVGGENYSVDSTANSEIAYGVVEWDPNQIAGITSEYTAGDLIPVLPFFNNPGMVFQGWVLDTDGNKGPDTVYDCGAVGFAIADYANRSYAAQMYYVADTNAVAQHLVLYAIAHGFGG